MLNVMLDLETLGNEPGACILSIGACVFDPLSRKIDSTFYTHIELQDSIRNGFSINASTINWWMMQSNEARAAVFNVPANACMRVVEALANFGDWIYDSASDPSEVLMWGNGASFDNVLLSYAYRKFAMPLPWSYKGDRCYRTIRNMFKDVPHDNNDTYTSHVAIDDAVSQALHLMKIASVKGIELK